MNVIRKVFFIALMIWMLYYVAVSATTATIDTEGARIRKSPNTESEIVTIAYKGEKVEIVEKQNEWYKVKYGNSQGYIREDLLKLDEQQEENKQEENTTEEELPVTEEPQKQTQEEAKEIEKILTEDSFVRLVPSLSSSKIDHIAKGTKVTVIQVINNWSCIRFNNRTAWIPNYYLADVEQETEQPTDSEQVIKTGYINVDIANVREEPNTTSTIVTTLTRNKPVEILAEVDGWYKIKLENHAAYISKSLISDTETQSTSRSLEEPRQNTEKQDNVLKEVYVNTSVANVRRGPSTSFSVLTRVNRKDKLEVVGEENGWYKIKIKDDQGYILKTLTVDNIADVVEPTVAKTEVKNNDLSTVVGNGASATGESIVAYANQFLGCRYVYGGAGPSSFDCSGFTQYVYKNFGISLVHSAVSQASAGVPVSKSELQIGDLIIFNDWDNRSIGHCGIYIGNSRFIHAANPSRGVVTDTFASGYYYERYVSARRLI
jgi:cell wall-associated NlpC family hydrolase